MPFIDGTGPRGEGPATGWGRGPCAGAWSGFGPGMGFGRRVGRGVGYGLRWAAPAAPDRKAALADRANALERELARVRQQLTDLGAGEPAAR
jgi:Family of unknown function (DUF5320)